MGCLSVYAAMVALLPLTHFTPYEAHSQLAANLMVKQKR